MTQRIILGDTWVEYELKQSPRARRFRLSMQLDGTLKVTVPLRLSLERIEPLIRAHTDWILHHQKKMRAKIVQQLPAMDDLVSYKRCRKAAAEFVTKYLATLVERETVPKHVVRIKNHRTRWGSCSRQGTLNFNYRIVLLPSELAEYIIIHEVCHLYELNHSFRFWNQVARFLPDYAIRRKRLQDYTWKKD